MRRPICRAFAKSRGRHCQRPVGLRRDGSYHVVCRNHGSETPPYAERPISEAGKKRIGDAARATWKRYHALKEAGLPCVACRQKKATSEARKAKAPQA